MPCVSDSELAKVLRSGEISSLYFFYGKDVASIEAYTKKLISKLVKKENQDYNFHSFEGKSLNLSDLADVCEALPMFCDRVCVCVNDLNAESMNASDFDYLIKILTELPDTTTVIIYATGIDILSGKKSFSGKNKKLFDLATKKGYSCDFDYKKPAELVKIITDRVEKHGSTISKKSAEYLANQCLSNLLLIGNELDKLCDYSNGEEITNETIDLLVSKQLDSNAFALAKAAAQFDGKKAMVLLEELYEQQVDSISISSAISMAFIDLYRARLALNDGVSQSDVISDFTYKGRDFVVRNAFRDCNGVLTERLRRCIEILAGTDIALKSSKTASRLLIEQAITSMLIKN